MKMLFISLCAGLTLSFILFTNEAIRWVDDMPKPYEDSDLHKEDNDG